MASNKILDNAASSASNTYTPIGSRLGVTCEAGAADITWRGASVSLVAGDGKMLHVCPRDTVTATATSAGTTVYIGELPEYRS